MALEADFHPVMLLINNIDKPGFNRALGTMLGEANINIATFHLGRQAASKTQSPSSGSIKWFPMPSSRSCRRCLT
jgi:hypothetical protein